MTPEMKRRVGVALAFAFIGALLLFRLASFGIWDPWELNVADAARDLSAGEATEWGRAPLSTWAVAHSFSAFGIQEWAGRLPLVLAGMLTLVAAFFLTRRFADRRAGIFTILIIGTTPIFLLNAREMLGDAFAFASSGLVGLMAAGAALSPSKSGSDDTKRRREVGLWLGGLLVAIVVSMFAGGALLTVCPPLFAVAAVALLGLGRETDPARRMGVYGVLAIAAVVGAAVARAVVQDAAGYSAWLGGAPVGGDPPSFEVALQAVFHGFAAWSGLTLIALARLLSPSALSDVPADGDDGESVEEADRRYDFRLAMLLWAALAYGALTLYTSRYGVATYTGVIPIGVAIALFLREVEDSKRGWWVEAAVMALLVGLVIRDYALFPGGSVDSLPARELIVPEIFNPRGWWAAVLGLFVVAMTLGLVATPTEAGEGPNPRAPYRWLRKQWSAGPVARTWLVLGGVVLAGMVAFGLVCLVGGEGLPLTTIAIRAGKVLLVVPFAIAIAMLAVPWSLYLFGRLGRFRLWPVFGAAAIVGVYVAQIFLPALSEHFSPRQVYDTYNELHAAGEPLGEYRVSGRAAAYYAEGDIEDIADQSALLTFLQAPERHWAVLPADELPSIDRAFRGATHRHLFVADGHSARVVLVTNQAVEGHADENYLATAVLDEVPNVQHRVGGVFDERIELIGYDIEAPQEGYLGASQPFAITWYWRALNRVPGSYQIFLHIDGQGNRLNGDHETVDGKYPVRLWDEGDIIVDRQELRIPANYRPGPYTLWIGFYSGGTRLPVSSGDDDGDNRLRAGTLQVR